MVLYKIFGTTLLPIFFCVLRNYRSKFANIVTPTYRRKYETFSAL